jgi:hypothetical protein
LNALKLFGRYSLFPVIPDQKEWKDIFMKEKLLFLAGGQALDTVREKGLSMNDVDVIAGAAGGPKWLVLSGLDRVIFGEFFRDRKEPLFLLGSSIGSFRFAAAARKNPLKAIDIFEEAYVSQSYSPRPSARDITAETRRILELYCNDATAGEILDHPFIRLNILADRALGPARSESRPLLAAGLAMAAAANLLNRGLMGCFFRRTLFHDPRDVPPFFEMNDFTTDKVALDSGNLCSAIMASGAIPVAMEGVSGISGAPEGIYRDGGMIDYHMDIPFGTRGLVLYPHFLNRIIPGWFDKHIFWRKPPQPACQGCSCWRRHPNLSGAFPWEKSRTGMISDSSWEGIGNGSGIGGKPLICAAAWEMNSLRLFIPEA